MAAIFSKTAVAPFPLVLLGMAWWRRGRIDRRDAMRSLLFFALAVAAGALGWWIQHAAHPFIVRPDSFWARLAAAGWAVWFYLGKTLLPLNLILVYPGWHVDAANLLSFLPDLLLVALFWVAWKYRSTWGKAILAGLGYFVILLLPVLGFVDITFMRTTYVADHWQYFAMIGPVALAAACVSRGGLCYGGGKSFLAVSTAAPLALGLLTWSQCRLYADEYLLWKTTVAGNPRSFFAQGGFGRALFHIGRTDEAIAHLQKALEIEPNYCDARYDLGNIALRQGRVSEAMTDYQKVLEMQPDFVLALNNLAWVLATAPQVSLRNGSQAITLARRADQLSGGKNANVLSTLAAAYAEAGRFPEAIDSAQKAVSLAIAGKDQAGIAELRRQLGFYQRGSPYRDPLQTAAAAGPPH
jgi:tetratricopeptide (TPR) repeat protein